MDLSYKCYIGVLRKAEMYARHTNPSNLIRVMPA